MLKNVNFKYLLLGRTMSNLGDSIYYIALSWYIMQVTDSGLWLGVFNFAIFIPNALSFLIGPYIDKYNKRMLLIICEWGQLLPIMALTLIVFNGIENPYIICIIVATASFFGMNTYTIQDAFIPKLVSKKDLAHAQMYMSFSYNAVDYVFNALTGIMLKYLSLLYLLMIDVFALMIAIITFSKINYKEKLPKILTTEKNKTVFLGFKYIFSEKSILKLTLGGALVNFCFGGLSIYQVIIANDQNSPILYGFIMSSMAIGTLIGSTIASKIVLSKYTIGRIQVFATLFFGVTLLANALFVSSKFIIVSLAISFIFLGVTHVSNKPFYQILIPEQHLGKVFSTKASISIITMPLGSLFFGWLSLYINPNIFFILFGSSYCFIGIVYLLDSKIRDFSLNDN